MATSSNSKNVELFWTGRVRIGTTCFAVSQLFSTASETAKHVATDGQFKKNQIDKFSTVGDSSGFLFTKILMTIVEQPERVLEIL